MREKMIKTAKLFFSVSLLLSAVSQASVTFPGSCPDPDEVSCEARWESASCVQVWNSSAGRWDCRCECIANLSDECVERAMVQQIYCEEVLKLGKKLCQQLANSWYEAHCRVAPTNS